MAANRWKEIWKGKKIVSDGSGEDEFARFIELKKANGNFSEVGRKYGVSPNAIIKRLKINGYPYHSCDYKKSPARK